MRDLVDHIRSVHFALVIASSVLIATSLAQSNRSLAQAIRDAKAVAALSTDNARDELERAIEAQGDAAFERPRVWNAATANPARIVASNPRCSYGQPTVDGRPAQSPIGHPGQSPPAGDDSGPAVAPGAAIASGAVRGRCWPGPSDLEFEPWLWDGEPDGEVFASPYPGWLYLESRRDASPVEPMETDRDTSGPVARVPGHEAGRLVTIRPWNRLADFEAYWNGIPTLAGIPRLLPEGSGYELECGDDQRRTFTFVAPQTASTTISYRTEWDEGRGRMSIETILPYDNLVDRWTCVFPPHDAPLVRDARETVVRKLRELNTDRSGDVLVQGNPLAPFGVAFNDLDRQTTNLKNMPFNDLTAELLRRLDESERSIQIFSATFPSTVIASVGTLMVVGSLLYVLMHLTELAAAVGAPNEAVLTGYVGLYRQTLARVVTVVTLVGLPSAAVWLVLDRADRGVPAAVAFAAASVTAALGCACVAKLRGISNAVPSRSTPATATPADV